MLLLFRGDKLQKQMQIPFRNLICVKIVFSDFKFKDVLSLLKAWILRKSLPQNLQEHPSN